MFSAPSLLALALLCFLSQLWAAPTNSDTFVIEEQTQYYLDDSQQQAIGDSSSTGSKTAQRTITVSRVDSVASTPGAHEIISNSIGNYSVSTEESYSATLTQFIDFSACQGQRGQAYFSPYYVRTIGHFEQSSESASRNEPMIHPDGAAWGKFGINCGV